MFEESATQQDVNSKIRNYAVALLARRDYPTQELKSKLEKKFAQDISLVAKDIPSETITWLQGLGYLNDESYCSAFIRSEIAKGRGRLRIQQNLRQKKLPSDLIESSLNAVDVDWVDQAVGVMQRRFKTPPQDIKSKAKLIRYLQYRGFVPEEIFTALECWNEDCSD